ncbi:MAG: hypothetical protein ACO1OB_12120 [Archangium sp.]
MKQLLFVALASACLAACSCDPAGKSCSTTADCDSGQICSGGQCRATSTGGAGGSGGTGGSGGSGGSGGAGGGGSTVVTGCNPADVALNPTKDTDCDGLTDAEEYGTDHGGGARTDPCNSDSDGDGLADGVEFGKNTTVSTTCGTKFVPDADPNSKSNPTARDTDGDGLDDGVEDANRNGRTDANETNPVKKDTDCDGYSDGDESTGIAGCVTNGTMRDTDGDGLSDGVEGGLLPVGADPMGCTYTTATYDSDSSTKTNACGPDTDGDGIQDGAEDTNLNGRHDMGELNPNDMADGTGPAQQACATTNLKPITFHTSGFSDVQLALEPAFSEVSAIANPTDGERGYVFYDPATRVGGVALTKTPAGGMVALEEALGRTNIGGVSGPLTQTFTTWDGFAAIRAIYDVSGNGDAKTKINDIAKNYIGMNATGLLSGTAGTNGPFKVVAEFVQRSPTRAVVVIGVVPASLYTGQALFRIDDAAGGTSLAQYGDFANTQCEVFTASVGAKVDFVWVVDDSCSMESSQTALANAGMLFSTKLATAGLDWRAGGVSTGWFASAWDGSIRDWTTSTTVMNGWFSGAGSFGIDGSGAESGFISAQNFINRAGSPTASSGLRTDAQTHLIFLTDTAEQSGGIDPSQMQTFLTSRGTLRAVAHGITCPAGQTCGQNESPEAAVSEYATLISATGGVQGNIRTFNPTNPTMQQRQQQSDTIDAILNAVIGGTGTQLQRPPISATIKVAVSATQGTCNLADVPRSRTAGWDIDAATRRIVFFGACIPANNQAKVAVSYKYWNENSPNADGDACGGTCQAPQVCDPNQRSCVCAANCGGCGAGLICEPTSCQCIPDIG